jgi:hypothetical protein
MKQWKVKFMRKGSEPPYPFGKSERIVLAETKAAAIDVVRADGIVSPRFKITASACPSNTSHHDGAATAPSVDGAVRHSDSGGEA